MNKKTTIMLLIVLFCTNLLCLGAAVFIGHSSNVRAAKHAQELTKKDAQVQELDKKLQIAESNLLTQKELNELALNELSVEVKDLIKKNDLALQSRDQTLARLISKINGGNSSVTVDATAEVSKETLESIKIGYEWKDKYNRFHLLDPNIWTQNNETFISTQYLRIKGYVLQGKNGLLQTKHIEVEELYLKDNENGTQEFVVLPGSSFELVDATFDYTLLPKSEKGFFDIIQVRPYASIDTAIYPGIGLELVQLGHWIDWLNIGIGAELSANFSDVLNGSLQSSRAGFTVQYHLVPPFLATNFAIGAGISVPFNDLTTPIFTIDAVMYLTDPIPLFK